MRTDKVRLFFYNSGLPVDCLNDGIADNVEITTNGIDKTKVEEVIADHVAEIEEGRNLPKLEVSERSMD